MLHGIPLIWIKHSEHPKRVELDEFMKAVKSNQYEENVFIYVRIIQ